MEVGPVTLDLFRLRVFVTVVDRNGYSAAARHLNLAQPTVSHHVAELEKSLDAPLLRYEQRAVHLTPSGREVYRVARALLTEQERLRESLDDLKQGRRGRVRFGASIAFEQRYFLDRVIGPFTHAHPGTFLSMQFGHSRRQAQAVLDRELDVAYVIRWHLPNEARFEPLHSAALTFLAAREHPLARQARVGVDDVARAGLITAPLTSVEDSFYQHVLREAGLTDNSSLLQIDGLAARIMAAEAGLGVVATFIPGYASGRSDGPLVALQMAGMDRTPTVEVGLVHRHGEPLAMSAQALADWLRRATSDGAPVVTHPGKASWAR